MVLQSAPLDFTVEIALLYVYILIMEFSVMKRVLAQNHPVIMPMDVRPPPYHQQVGTIMLLWWNLFPFLNHMLHYNSSVCYCRQKTTYSDNVLRKWWDSFCRFLCLINLTIFSMRDLQIILICTEFFPDILRLRKRSRMSI